MNKIFFLGVLTLSVSSQLPMVAQAADAVSADEVIAPVDAQAPMTPGATPAPATAPAPAAEAPTETAAEDEMAPADSVDAQERRNRSGVGVALRLSILQGVGIEGIYSLSQHFNVRAQVNYLKLNRNLNKDGIDYDAHVKLQTIGALIDYHPFAGSFRFSAGLYNDGNNINANASCRAGSSCKVGDDTVNNTGAGDDPHIGAAIDMKKSVAPYLGFGWGNAMKGWPVHFGLDIGVMFQGSPTVGLVANGQGTVCATSAANANGGTCPGGSPHVDLASDPTFQAQLTKERANLQDTVSKYKIWPAISFTIGYRFGSHY